ncbi:BREX-2 system adenine-specific DNA-methyltransferase PglX [Kocuria rosea]|uniref:BREX-2 system adenine-specific DNA-methyltransferase PglX n=1 Tax=Kocuria rosea TaxID=1275 RepID=UPI00232C4AAB|nr:BREX-2 system adenine-specific DNA-methyltransferase PglX [Kocuria rosea]
MIDSSALLADLKAQLRVLQADLKERADDPTTTWGGALQQEYATALRRERTGLTWGAWRDNEVDQAAVAWIVATTFVRFCEDNDLLVGATLDGMPVPVGWIAGPGDRLLRARENQTAYFRVNTSHHDRDWLQQSFRVLAAQPAGASLVDPRHNPVWTAEVSAEAAKGLVNFWRQTYDHGGLVHNFTDPNLDTRFLGDLYQDLSDHAKKTYALLQTPVFVEEFILDRTLTPGITEFGVDELKIIDPTCGSGHFLLGAFERLNRHWAAEAPGLDPKQRVRKAMEAIHGVDLNPFAVAIARFRLTVAGIVAAGENSLVGVPEWGFHLAIGDSLLGEQGVTGALFGEETYVYATEDLGEYRAILQPGRYHVVIGNPPYITVKDPALNAAYRLAYKSASGTYALSVPFMELFFRLAIKGSRGEGAGYIGQITSNSFMKRKFGKKLVEDFFAGYHIDNPVDLTHVVDSSGAWMPGHNFDGTPTVIIFGRRRLAQSDSVRCILGIKDDPGKTSDPANGPVWREILSAATDDTFRGKYVSVGFMDRKVLAQHPWVLSGGDAPAVKSIIEQSPHRLRDFVDRVGFFGDSHADEQFFISARLGLRNRVASPFLRDATRGSSVREWAADVSDTAIFPYDDNHQIVDARELDTGLIKYLWPMRTVLWARRLFNGGTYRQGGVPHFAWHQLPKPSGGPRVIFAEVATHNHFVLHSDETMVPNRTAPVIDFPRGADPLPLLTVLNSSTACFWLKQVSQKKGGDADVSWLRTYQYSGAKVEALPVPDGLTSTRSGRLTQLARQLSETSPATVIQNWRENPRPGVLQERLHQAERAREEIIALMVFEQEELDWDAYRQYGLIDDDLTYQGVAVNAIKFGSRAFELVFARKASENEDGVGWFDRHGAMPMFSFPEGWPDDYRNLVERRISIIESDPHIGLIETPDFKRRWESKQWPEKVQEATRRAMLDCLEDPTIWVDETGPAIRSVLQVADRLRRDVVFGELAEVASGIAEPELSAVIETIVADESVPYLAAFRYTASGREKFDEWQVNLELQRREDRGESVNIPVPRTFSSTGDFMRPEYYRSRGKFDLAKERFILYPGVGREGDNSLVLGWAGWSHRDQAVALVREIMNQQALGASNEALVPLIAGLVELEPWLHQWHIELEPEFGSSAAQAVTSQIDQFLAQLQMTRDDVSAWRPPAAARGRRRNA